MKIVHYPVLKSPNNIDIFPMPLGQVGTQSFSGFEQTGDMRALVWRLEASFTLVAAEDVLTWRAFIGQLEGRANAALIPLMQREGFKPDGEAFGESDGVTFDDGAAWDDDALFDDGDIGDVYVTGTMGENTLTLDLFEFGYDLIKPGMYFGVRKSTTELLGDDPYECVGIEEDETGQTIITVKGALRRDYDGHALSVRPCLLAKLDAQDGGRAALQAGFMGQVSVAFTQVVDW